MLDDVRKNSGLNVAGRADLKVDTHADQPVDQIGVFNRPHAMTNPLWLQKFESLNDARWPQRFACVDGAVQPGVPDEVESRDMGCKGEVGVVPCKIDGHNALVCVFFHKPCDLYALLLTEMP